MRKVPRQRSYENGKDYKSFDSGSRLQISNRLRRLSEDGKCSALNWAGVAFSSRRVSASGLCEWYIKFELIVNDVSWAIFQRKWLLLLGNAVAEYAWYSFDGNKIWTWMNMNRICSKSPRQRSYENGKDYKSFDSGSRLQISNRLRRLFAGREMQRIKLSRGCVRDAAKSAHPLWRSVLVASSPTRRGTPWFSEPMSPNY
jgi:hypothetical protein